MPGSSWMLRCPTCDGMYEITTGATLSDRAGEAAVLSYEQMVCPACPELFTVTVTGDDHDPATCPSCGGTYQPWSGRAEIPADSDEEIVEGPCPRCGTPLEAEKQGLWD